MTLDWPTLVTERLILRPWRPEDFAPYARFSADEEAMRYLGRDGRPTDAAETWRTICLFIGHWYLRGYTLWAVEERASGEFVGRVGPWKPEGWPAAGGRTPRATERAWSEDREPGTAPPPTPAPHRVFAGGPVSPRSSARSATGFSSSSARSTCSCTGPTCRSLRRSDDGRATRSRPRHLVATDVGWCTYSSAGEGRPTIGAVLWGRRSA